MPLKLFIENEDRLPDGGPLSVEVSGRGLDIGRDEFLDWTLPDPTSFISGKHCEIRYIDGAYVLDDCSTNGTYLNGDDQRMPRPYELRDGDRLQIGHYIVAVTITGADAAVQPASETDEDDPYASYRHEIWDPAGEAAEPIDPRDLKQRKHNPAAGDFLDSYADISAPRPGRPGAAPPSGPPADPWSDGGPLEGGPAGRPEAPSFSEGWTDNGGDPWSDSGPAASSGDAWGNQPAGRSGGDAWDDVGDGGRSEPAGGPTPGGEQAPPPPPPPGSLSRKAPEQQPQQPPAAARTPAEQPPEFGRRADSDFPADPDGGAEALWPDAPEAARPAPPPEAPPPPKLKERLRSPHYRPPQQPDENLPDVAPPEYDSTEAQRVIAKLAEGAGIPKEVLMQRDPEELAGDIGALLNLIAANLQQLLSARASAKAMTRASNRTMVQAIDNNPLKFLPNPEEALRVMLGPPTSSYLDARRAIEDTFGDLKTHQINTYAAMQHAVRRMMEELSPENIESTTDTSGLMTNKKAKLWETYRTRWDSKVEAHENGLVDVFMLYFADYYDRNAK